MGHGDGGCRFSISLPAKGQKVLWSVWIQLLSGSCTMNKRSLPRMQFNDLAAEPSEHLSTGTKRAAVSRGTGIQIRTRLNWGWRGWGEVVRQPPPRVFSHFSTGLSNSQVSSKRWVVERFRGPTELRPWMAAGREAIYCKSTETQSSIWGALSCLLFWNSESNFCRRWKAAFCLLSLKANKLETWMLKNGQSSFLLLTSALSKGNKTNFLFYSNSI